MTTGTHKPATQTQALLFHAHRELLSVLPHNRLQHQHRHGHVPPTLKRLPAQSRFRALPASRRPVPLTTKRHLHLISISFPSSIHQLASPRPPSQRPIAHDSPGPERAGTGTLIHLADPGPLPTKENQNQNRSLKNAACTRFGSWSCARSGSDRSGQVKTVQDRTGQVRSGQVWTDGPDVSRGSACLKCRRTLTLTVRVAVRVLILILSRITLVVSGASRGEPWTAHCGMMNESAHIVRQLSAVSCFSSIQVDPEAPTPPSHRHLHLRKHTILVHPSPTYVRMDARTPGRRAEDERRTPYPRRPGTGRCISYFVISFSRALVLPCFRAQAFCAA